MPLNVCKAKATKDLVVAGSGLFRRIERCQIKRNYVMNNFSRCPIVLGHRWMATKRQIREQEKLKVKMSSSDVERKSINGDDDIEERLLKASTMAKSNVETGISIDKSGLYQPHMHNNLPDFNDPKLNYEEATPLFNEISNVIGLRGPISVAEYFRYALLHPLHGYYTAPPMSRPLNSDLDDDDTESDLNEYEVIGLRGDFTTAPEISQIFGEMICIYFVHEWRHKGSKAPVQLIELGPGNGTLINDIIRVASSSFPDFIEALSTEGGGIRLVEQSPALRRQQAKKLNASNIQSENLFEHDPEIGEQQNNSPIEYNLSAEINVGNEKMNKIPVTCKF